MNFGIDSLAFGKIGAKSQVNQDQREKTTQLENKEKYLPLSGVVSLFCILLISFGSYAQAYQNKIYPGVKVAGVNLGAKTQGEAVEALTETIQKMESQTVLVEIANTQIETKLSDIGIDYATEGLVQTAFKVGHSKNWLKNIQDLGKLSYRSQNLDLVYNLDEQRWANFMTTLTSKVKQKAEEPSFELQDGQIKVVLGEPGMIIDAEKIKADILNQAKIGTVDKISVTVAKNQIIVPDEQVKNLIIQAENYTTPISFTLEDKTFMAQKADILHWLNLVHNGENFNIEISDSAISGFVAGLASKIDIRAKSKEATPSGQVLSEGVPGQALNRTAAISQIKNVLNANGSRQIALQVSPVEPQTKIIYPAGTPGLFPGKYIEIVLSKQTLYAFDGQNLVRSFLISSGTASHPSPQGVFAIYSRCRSCLMAGPGYYLPGVQWINRFYDGFSIHGTYWHHNFGHPMSHGCINATNGDAAFIYDWAPMGTPVYVHR